MNEILMCGTDPVGQLYKDTKAEATSIAPIEVSPAESSHSVGTHIMVDGVRYRVTSAISIGDTLTIGTNISAENIEDNLNAENIAYDSNNSVKDKIDDKASKDWKYVGTLDMSNLPSTSFNWTATESGTDFTSANEVLFVYLNNITGGIPCPRISCTSPIANTNNYVGIDGNFANTRIYALGSITNATTINFVTASNGGMGIGQTRIYYR